MLCDGGHFFVAQSHSIDVCHWSALSISSHSRIIFVSFFCGHCVIFFEWSQSSAAFCCVDPCFVDLVAAFGQVFCLFLNKFEELIDVIFPSLVFHSLCWSCILSWILGSIQQLLSAISRSVMWLFSAPVSISFFVSLVPASNLRLFHLFRGFLYPLNVVSTQSYSSISAASISSSLSLSNDTSLSWSLWKTELCPSSLSPLLLPKSLVFFLRWSRLFVSQSFCIFFPLKWWVGALWVPMFLMRRTSSEV